MVIAPIQPGTFSPLTVSIRAFASTFSTVPRNVCSFFVFTGFLPTCAALGFDGAIEAGAVPGVGLGAVLADCCASTMATPRSEVILRDWPASPMKAKIAAVIRKTATFVLLLLLTSLIRLGSPAALNIRHCRLSVALGTNSATHGLRDLFQPRVSRLSLSHMDYIELIYFDSRPP